MKISEKFEWKISRKWADCMFYALYHESHNYWKECLQVDWLFFKQMTGQLGRIRERAQTAWLWDESAGAGPAPPQSDAENRGRWEHGPFQNRPAADRLLISESQRLVEFILKRLVAERPQLLLGGKFPVPVVWSYIELGCSLVSNFELENPVARVILWVRPVLYVEHQNLIVLGAPKGLASICFFNPIANPGSWALG